MRMHMFIYTYGRKCVCVSICVRADQCLICNISAAIAGRLCPKYDTLFAGVCVPCVGIECPDELYFKVTFLHAMFYANAHNTNVFCIVLDIRIKHTHKCS